LTQEATLHQLNRGAINVIQVVRKYKGADETVLRMAVDIEKSALDVIEIGLR
jgi:hypothetical protein